MRNKPLKGLIGKSPIKKTYDFSKKKDYSPEAGKGTIGSKIVKAVTPENTTSGMLGSVVPVGKVAKVGKAIYNYFNA